jgi:hypothetical protein
MSDEKAIDALIVDLQWQIDEMRPRGVKTKAGQPYNPSHYKRGLEDAIDRGGVAVADFVRSYLDKPPSASYQRLAEANSLDLACEWLVADEARPYASLFSDADRAAAMTRLGPHLEEIKRRQAEHQARMAAATERVRAKGVPRRWELDAARHPRRGS